MCFGSSALASVVESGIMRGRPFGGLMMLVKKSLIHSTEIVCAADRYVIIVVGNLLLVNLYLPCNGTADRIYICEDVFNVI